jgi:hypothetical protein
MKRALFAALALLLSPSRPVDAQRRTAPDSSVHAARLRGEWTLSLRVVARASACSPSRLEGVSTQASVTISDSVTSHDDFWGRKGLRGSTSLSWDWLGRAPFSRRGRFHIVSVNDSTIHFTIDYFVTHDGGMYGRGRWVSDSIVGEWEQAGYCPTPSGTFVLRRTTEARK